MRTLLLDRDTWGLCLDAQGNLAIADEPYALAQDAASAIKAFRGEVWYDSTVGVPYFQDILGLFPPPSLVKILLETEALRVPDVASAKCYITNFSPTTRVLTGQVQVTSASTQEVSSASFAITVPTAIVAPPAIPNVSILNATL
jgi:hypothetical protein